MRPGDVVESAIWLSGAETRELRDRYEGDVREAIADLCSDQGFIHGPVRFVELRPGDDRVPEVPDHIQGPDVRLLIAESDILTELIPVVSRFVDDIDRDDLERLRLITRRAHVRANPGAPRLTDRECDDIIEEAGPDAAADAVRNAVDRRLLH